MGVFSEESFMNGTMEAEFKVAGVCIDEWVQMHLRQACILNGR